LMLHGPLQSADLRVIYGQHALELDGELARLAHLGLVLLDESSHDIGQIVSVETRLIQPLTMELRTCNLL
jgi:hypothetical protein